VFINCVSLLRDNDTSKYRLKANKIDEMHKY
jgi:hypothetical protein